jgi:hypothetical protein
MCPACRISYIKRVTCIPMTVIFHVCVVLRCFCLLVVGPSTQVKVSEVSSVDSLLLRQDALACAVGFTDDVIRLRYLCFPLCCILSWVEALCAPSLSKILSRPEDG